MIKGRTNFNILNINLPKFDWYACKQKINSAFVLPKCFDNLSNKVKSRSKPNCATAAADNRSDHYRINFKKPSSSFSKLYTGNCFSKFGKKSLSNNKDIKDITGTHSIGSISSETLNEKQPIKLFVSKSDLVSASNSVDGAYELFCKLYKLLEDDSVPPGSELYGNPFYSGKGKNKKLESYTFIFSPTEDSIRYKSRKDTLRMINHLYKKCYGTDIDFQYLPQIQEKELTKENIKHAIDSSLRFETIAESIQQLYKKYYGTDFDDGCLSLLKEKELTEQNIRIAIEISAAMPKSSSPSETNVSQAIEIAQKVREQFNLAEA